MSRSPEVIEPTGPAWPPGPNAVIAVLVRACTGPARTLIATWAADLRLTGTTVHVVNNASEAVRRVGVDDGLILPVRVTWSSGDDPGLQRLLLRGPWRAAGQTMVKLRHPEKCQLLLGEPATVHELATRWSERSTAVDERADGFHAFIGRQADIALERTRRRIQGDRFRAPRAVVDEVLTHRDFVARAEQLAAELGRDPAGVLTDARAYLEEMATEERRAVIDLWVRMARRLHSRAYQLDVDQEQVQRLRELSAKHTLVFLPSHRSNLDPYVMTSVTNDSGLPLNHVLGGINMAFWPLGPLARRVGAVFIRRSFRDNEVYRFVLARYLGFLVSKRFNLEWYMEGGRSRTGKLLPPKLGLLNYLADAVEEMDLREVLIIPTSTVYDLLHEVADMTSESRGAPKQAEGLSWLLRYVRTQGSSMGTAHVRFGEPLNLHEALAAQAVGDKRLARSKVAFEICSRINRATVATAPALASFALLGLGDQALTLAEVRDVLAPVLDYTASRGTPMDVEARKLSTRDGILTTLKLLVEHGVVVSFDGGSETVYGIGPEQELVAAFYRNATIHWFVNRAIVELALLRATAAGPDEDPVHAAWDEAYRLRDLLKFEFFFSEKEQFRHELEEELTLIDPQWPERGKAVLEIVPALHASGAFMAHRVLRGFVEAYMVVADRLAALGTMEARESAVVQDCLGLGQQYLRQGRVTSAEAVSSHLFRSGLKLAANRDLITGGAGAAERRREFARELHDVLHRLDEITKVDTRRTPLLPAQTGANA